MNYTITDSSPNMTYKPKNTPGIKQFDDHIKDGQKKLFDMELLFLKIYGGLSDTIIYAGAAPGHHLNELIPMYPKHKWILYDPEEMKLDWDKESIFGSYSQGSVLLYGMPKL